MRIRSASQTIGGTKMVEVPGAVGSSRVMMTGRKLCLLAGVVVLASLSGAGLVFWKDFASGIREWWRLRANFDRLPDNAQGYPEYRHRKTGLVFVRVPGGSFLMGTSREEISSLYPVVPGIQRNPNRLDGRAESEKHHHQVTLSPFLIAKYEVTQEEWNDLMGGLPTLLTAVPHSMGPRFPIEMVSWEDAQRFCEKNELSLPSEAQWEYACRGGSTGAFSGTGLLDDMGWYKENSGETSHLVGTKRPNGFGLHDMHGNVEEWCRDYFAPFYSFPEAVGPDPVCTGGGLGTYVKRGGSYWGSAFTCRSAARSNEGPGSQGHGTGVRPMFLLK